ncbi:MAG: acyltransferase family protein [Halobacteriota archaeon]
MAPRKRLLELDLLRAIAIVFILVHHIAGYAYNATFLRQIDHIDYQVFPLFVFGLSLFFFVSGYALYYNNTTFSTLREVGGFLKKRAIRIYPLYWIAIAAFITLGVGAWGGFTWIIVQVCGAQGLLSPRFGRPVITLWFIGVILLYYLIYPFIVRFSSGSKQLVLALLTPLLLFVVLRVAFNLIDFRFFLYYAIFFGGFLASKYDIFNRYTVKRSHVAASILLFVAVLVLIANIDRFDVQLHAYLYRGLDGAVAPLTIRSVLAVVFADVLSLLFVYITFNLSRLAVPLLNSTSREIVRGVAFSSFCVYLFHRPFLVLFTETLNATSLAAPAKSFLVIICGVPLIFIASYALQRGWDTLLLKALTSRKPPARGTADAK